MEDERHDSGTNFILVVGVETTKKALSMISEEASGEWQAERDIRSFPSNAFGKVDFVKEGLGGKKPSKVLFPEIWDYSGPATQASNTVIEILLVKLYMVKSIENKYFLPLCSQN